ncbi:hypothetical protein BTM317_08740 [Helicobacter pylori]|uniref:hypothetical protein n=1 Tax=Helicobacter pylori TaxID=210 RepID=UPI0003D7A7AB|nr:hypothetical protein [Helicobacter pylori]WJI98576.1 hypothetical protein QAD59_01100 [Helicobacter pylori]WQW23289.1 hypothetical protein KVL47_06115 [Helicobacter pylori]WRC27491.1 hypothetical protein KVE89_06010 [Helicobacter pylori]BAW36916.1 putative uncharacterized protein [Helicobacter pylori]GHQ08535.1 hypothetical protein VN1212_06630 [Helicobacter pylori]
MNTNKNKNASHLTHEMKNEHGGLAEAGMKADTQPIFKALWGIAQEEAEGYKQAAEGYKKALEAKEKAYKIVNILKAINHDNNIIDIEPEDEKD